MSVAHAVHQMLTSKGQFGGGASKSNNNGGLLLFAILLILFIVRSFIVQFSFNKVIPGLVQRFSSKPILNNYRPITLVEAIFLTLLISSLVN